MGDQSKIVVSLPPDCTTNPTRREAKTKQLIPTSKDAKGDGPKKDDHCKQRSPTLLEEAGHHIIDLHLHQHEKQHRLIAEFVDESALLPARNQNSQLEVRHQQ